MKDIIGRRGKLVVEMKQHLFFEVREFVDENKEHITFIDRNGMEYTFRKSEIIQLSIV